MCSSYVVILQSRIASSARGVAASLPKRVGEQPARVTIDVRSWDEVTRASEAFLQKKFNPRITEMKLSELLLNCVQHATTQTESGPMAGRLLSLVLETNNDCRPTAKLMHMVMDRARSVCDAKTPMVYAFFFPAILPESYTISHIS
jgi:hypothetical protein